MIDPRRNAMRSVKIEKTSLMQIVRNNRDKHVKEYKEAIEDYKSGVLKVATDNLERAKTGNLETFKKIENRPPEPVSYEKEYSRAIRQLELSVDDVIEIEDDVFNQLVLDEWQWKGQFAATNSFLKSYTVAGSAR